MIKLRETPIDQPQLSFFMINHNVVGFYITMHNALAMAEIQCFQQLQEVVANIKVGESRIQDLEINVINMLEY